MRGSFAHPVQRLSQLLHPAFTQPAFAGGSVLRTLGTPSMAAAEFRLFLPETVSLPYCPIFVSVSILIMLDHL